LTGAGRIDAGAALAYVNNNDVQQTTRSPGEILTTETVGTGLKLDHSGYLNYATCHAEGAFADLRKFTAKIPYKQTFTSAPDVWLRWSDSDGYKSIVLEIDGDVIASTFDQFQNGLEIVDVTARHFVVEGYYWDAEFKATDGSECDTGPIPKKPTNFNIAYTAVGTEGTPPPILPAPPENVHVANSGCTGCNVELEWDSAPHAASYEVHRSDGGPFQQIATTTSTSYTDYETQLSNDYADPVFAYFIRSVNKYGTSSTSSYALTPVQTNTIAQTGLFLQNLSARSQGEKAAAVTWHTIGPVPARFVVEHRADSTAAWSRAGVVRAADSARVDTARGAAYRFETEDLAVGSHQFRLTYQLPTGPDAPVQLVGEEGETSAEAPTFASDPVRTRIDLDGQYELETYPNPVRSRATVELAVRESQDVRVGVYDVLGRRVATLFDGSVPAQQTEQIQLNVGRAGLASGQYFLQVRGETFSETQRVTVVR